MSRLHMGIDVGSTTVKVVVLDENKNTLFAEYRRHFSDIKSTVKGLFAEVKEVVKNEQFTVVRAVFYFQKCLICLSYRRL
mgnify:CR=1 FL=1